MSWAAPFRDEQLVVRDRREKEAVDAGLSRAEAWIFANDTVDVGLLRKLVAAGCPAELIARIII